MLGNRMAQKSFSQLPEVNIQRSSFNRSFAAKDTFDFDYLVPIMVDEVLPGDTVNLSVNTFMRLATQKVPIMDNMYVDFFFFYVPNRLIFDNWEKLLGARENPSDSIDFIMPEMDLNTALDLANTIYDKMGLPIDGGGTIKIKNTLPLRAYLKIWNDWFRDSNLQNSVAVPTDNGPDAMGDFYLLERGKRHDYFTSCLPTPQRGPAVSIPLGVTAPVISTNTDINFRTAADATNRNVVGFGGNAMGYAGSVLAGSPSFRFGTNTGLQSDLSAVAGTINQLREAFAMQSLFELDQRGGTRAVEIIQTHFNVSVPDFRLQRAEFLGGGTTNINSHPVANTTSTGQATLAAYGTASTGNRNIGFSKSFVEHGYIIGLACARGDITYQQGLDRMWNRSTRYDFFWPELANLGEQAVLSKEIYADGSVGDETVFGYQERWAEYRYKRSEIRGLFRSTNPTPLDQWHLAEEFLARPLLNANFIKQMTPIERAIAVTTEPHILADMWFNYTHARPLPVFSIPSNLARF
ncbi:major capsid protein [Apis mellifera associated microvirus 20]|nr:major capsid protein [Apis mellifera associated microvirus 20]